MIINKSNKMFKTYMYFLFKLFLITFIAFLFNACTAETEESCRKVKEAPLLQSCIINRANIDGTQLPYSDEQCIFILLEYSKCNQKRKDWR